MTWFVSQSSELRFSSGDSGSEPLTDVSVDMESSFGMATKFNGVADSRLVSLKYPLWRPEEYERGVRSSGVAPPADSRRGAGVMNPFTWYPLGFLPRLLLLLATDLAPNDASFSVSSRECSFFWSCNKNCLLIWGQWKMYSSLSSNRYPKPPFLFFFVLSGKFMLLENRY